MIGFGAMAGAAGEAGPRSEASHFTTSGAGGLWYSWVESAVFQKEGERLSEGR
jgi:hypothetical protein